MEYSYDSPEKFYRGRTLNANDIDGSPKITIDELDEESSSNKSASYQLDPLPTVYLGSDSNIGLE